MFKRQCIATNSNTMKIQNWLPVYYFYHFMRWKFYPFHEMEIWLLYSLSLLFGKNHRFHEMFELHLNYCWGTACIWKDQDIVPSKMPWICCFPHMHTWYHQLCSALLLLVYFSLVKRECFCAPAKCKLQYLISRNVSSETISFTNVLKCLCILRVLFVMCSFSAVISVNCQPGRL